MEKLDSINGEREKLIKDQQRFYLLQRSYYEFKQNIDQKFKEDDQKMTVGVINQLKEHIKTYAEKENYNIIISNTQLQNVGYADEAVDVTTELLDYAQDMENQTCYVGDICSYNLNIYGDPYGFEDYTDLTTDSPASNWAVEPQDFWKVRHRKI